MKINKEFRGLLKSFLFAFRGIGFCLKNERNMRIHVVTAFYVIAFSVIYRLQAHEYIILILAIGFVMVSEMINTAIEALVNLETPAYDLLARIAKDVAAGAVLLSAISSVVVGVILFLKQPQKFLDTVLHILLTPYLIIPFAIVFLFGLLFIFRGTSIFSKNDKVKVFEVKNEKKKFSDTAQLDNMEDVKIYEIKSNRKDA